MVADDTLELSVATLNLFVVAFLDVALENAGSGGLVETSSFQDMGGIHPVVGLAAHDMLSFGLGARELELPYWILEEGAMARLVEMQWKLWQGRD